MAQRWTFRPLSAADHEILRTATYMNMNWTGTERVSYRDVDNVREIRRYAALIPSRGDFGFVAEIDGHAVGICWLMFFESRDPGYGFIADGIPEMSLTVWTGYRDMGIGRSLLVRTLQEARNRGLTRVSISVEEGNPSVRLYRSINFEDAGGGRKGTYVISLG